MQPSIFSLSLLLLLLFLIHCYSCKPLVSAAQTPAPSPAPPKGPTNVVKILKKSGQFKTFIHLLKTTQLDMNLNSQLGDTNNGLTIFAPSDSAFSSLKANTMNSLTSQQKVELLQFHIVPIFLPSSQFQTVPNPLKTHAGSGPRFQLNVTTSDPSGSSVNISTGLTNTTISHVVYTDKHLAIYQVDKVLLPLDIFTPKPQAQAPAPALPISKADAENQSEDGDDPDDNHKSSTVRNFVMHHHNVVLLGVVAAVYSFL